MAWSAPRTWVSGEVITASLMNTHVRDQMNFIQPSVPIDVPFNAGNFTHSSGTFTVDSGDVVAQWYYKIGNRGRYGIILQNATVASSVGAALYITTSALGTFYRQCITIMGYAADGAGIQENAAVFTSPSTSRMELYRVNATAWSNITNGFFAYFTTPFVTNV